MLEDEDIKETNFSFANEIKNPYYMTENISDIKNDKIMYYTYKCYSNILCKINLGIILCCFSSCVLYILFLGVGIITNFISNLDIFIDTDNADLKWYTILFIYPLEGLAIVAVMLFFALTIIALILLTLFYCYYIKLKLSDCHIDYFEKIRQCFNNIISRSTNEKYSYDEL